MPVHVVATLLARPGRAAAVGEAFSDALPAFHAEAGCEHYAVLVGVDRVVTVERWADAQSIRAHGSGPAVAALTARIADLLAGAPDVQTLTVVAAGDPQKSSI